MTPTTLHPGERVDDRFVLTLRLAARRGVEVWRARQDPLKRDVVIKLVPQGRDPSRTARFKREAEALGRLNHRGIIDVYDHGEWGGWLFLVTAWVRGPLLSEKIGAPWPPAQAVELVRALAHAMAHAHEQEVVHRDLSPETVVLQQAADGELQPIVVDLSAARYEQSVQDTTSGGVPIGSAGYVSPERIQGAKGDARGDVYALGLILFELLTGTHPFRQSRSIETLAAQVQGDVPPLAEAHPSLTGLPAALDWVIRGATHRDPRARLQSARQLKDALALALAALGERKLHRLTPTLEDGELRLPEAFVEHLAMLDQEASQARKRPGRAWWRFWR